MAPSRRFELLTTTVLVVALLAAATAPAAAAEDHYEFTDDAYWTEQGEVVSITLEDGNEANDTFRFHLGTADQGLAAHATVVDENGDGEVTVRVNTSMAGQTNASAYLSAAGEDSISNASQSTSRLSHIPDAGDYDLRIGPADDPNETAHLVIEENESAADPISGTPESEPSGDPDFNESVVTANVAGSGVAEIPVRFGGAETVTVSIESDETGFSTVLELTDADDDGSATVTVDAAADAESPRDTVSVSNGDDAEFQSMNESVPSLEAGVDYGLGVAHNGSVVNVATLVVRDEPVETTTSIATESTETTTADTTESTTTANASATTATGTSDTVVPGFSAVLAVVALLAAAFLAVRR
ncbi:DUF7827 domain-containing protein [Haloferax gibbonsii]|uniref:PGF-CTERM sorting domain-containing protein n=1 Tax=Haloferax gibbonsii TaxID=35746 RepID=A0A0K1IQ10_HALGI|nr:PGF-CTERM sorting domain-containing protein [Haloferax gibbonsii]AKU06390.1 hypothetical protein ABY42_01010 [Haloferax gibbonsii]